MSRLREAAQAVIDMFYHRSWGTTSYIPASVEELRAALAEDRLDEEPKIGEQEAAVLAEREACAQACDEIHAKHIAEFGDYIEGSYAKDCAAAIRARRNT